MKFNIGRQKLLSVVLAVVVMLSSLYLNVFAVTPPYATDIQTLKDSFANLYITKHTGAFYGNDFGTLNGKIEAATPDTVFANDNKNMLSENFSCFNLASGGGIWPRLNEGSEVTNLYNEYLVDDSGNPYTDAVFYLYTGTVTGNGAFQIQYRDSINYGTIYYTNSVSLTAEMSNQWIEISLKDVDGVASLDDLSNVGRLWLYKESTLSATGMYLSDLIVVKKAPISVAGLNDFEVYEKAKNIDYDSYSGTEALIAAKQKLDENSDFQKGYLDYLAEKLNTEISELEIGKHTGAFYGNEFSGVGNITAATPDTAFANDNKNMLSGNFSCFNLTGGGGIWPRLNNGGEVTNLFNEYLVDDSGNPYTDAVFYLYTGTVTGNGAFQIQYRDSINYGTIYYTNSVSLTAEMSNQWIEISLKDVDGVASLDDLSNVGRLWLYKESTLSATGMYLSDLIVVKKAPISVAGLNDFEVYEKAKNIDYDSYSGTEALIAAKQKLDENSDFQKGYLDYLAEKLNTEISELEIGKHTGAFYGNEFSGVGNITAATPDTAFANDNKNMLSENFSCFNLTGGGRIWPRLYNGGEVINLYNEYLVDDSGNPYTDAVFYLYTGTVTGNGAFQIQYRRSISNQISPVYTKSIDLTTEMSNQWIEISLKDVDDVSSIEQLSEVITLWLYKESGLSATGMYLSDLIVITGHESPISYTSVADLFTKAKALDKSKYINTSEFDAAISAVEAQIAAVEALEKSSEADALISALQTAWGSARIINPSIIDITSAIANQTGISAPIKTDAPPDAPSDYQGNWYTFEKQYVTAWCNAQFNFNQVTIAEYEKFGVYVYATGKINDDPNATEFDFTLQFQSNSTDAYRISQTSIPLNTLKYFEINNTDFSTTTTSINKMNILFSGATQFDFVGNITVSELIGYKTVNATVPNDCTTLEEWYNAGVAYVTANDFKSGKEELNTALENIDIYLNGGKAVTMLGVKKGTYDTKIGYQFGTTALDTFNGATLEEYGVYIVPASATENNETEIYNLPSAEKIAGKFYSNSEGVTTYTASLLNIPIATNEYVAVSYAKYSDGKIYYSQEEIYTNIQ